MSVRLLKAAADYVRARGGKLLEGYPKESEKELPDAFAWSGLAGAYEKAGFREVARRSPARPIVRRRLGPRRSRPRKS